MTEDTTPRYTTRRMRDEIKKAEERGRQNALENPPKVSGQISISAVELLALKKLALISGALASSLSDPSAAREQRALTGVLVDVVSRAQLPSTPS